MRSDACERIHQGMSEQQAERANIKQNQMPDKATKNTSSKLSKEQKLVMSALMDLEKGYQRRKDRRLTADERAQFLMLKGAGISDRSACMLLGINLRTLYNYQQDHPEFVEIKANVADFTTDMARYWQQVYVAKGDKTAVKFELERKAPEYADKKDISIKHLHQLDDKQIEARLQALIGEARLIPDDIQEAEVVSTAYTELPG